LGASCARVCPTEVLCEGARVLSQDESPIRIGDLQRYVTDWAMKSQVELFRPGPPTGRRVAIVGGGPAGLSAARELAARAMRLPFSRRNRSWEDRKSVGR